MLERELRIKKLLEELEAELPQPKFEEIKGELEELIRS